MHDDAALGEAIDIIVTNNRSESVYLSAQGCAQIGWAVDGKTLFDPAPPTCQGLLVGEPGINDCAPVFDELAAGSSVHVPWPGRVAESVAVVDGCPDPPDSSETCSRMALVGDGAHELSLDIFLQYDPDTFIPSSPMVVTTPFDLPASSIAVPIAP